PFYLRRTKEALVSFPDPETGEVRKLFTRREVRTAAFDLDGEELEFYDQLTHYVEDQSIRASADDSARGRAVGFTMAMLQRQIESKLSKLKAILSEEGIFSNPQMKLLVFTEHKDSLDFLAGDGRNERPLGRLREWGLTVTQIHGSMKIGDRDSPGTRLHAER